MHYPTLYSNMRTLNGYMYNTFREAALAYGLLDDNQSNERCLEKASLYQMPTSLRNLFSTVLAYCNPVNPCQLFMSFEASMSEDLINVQRMSANAGRQSLLKILKSSLETMVKI